MAKKVSYTRESIERALDVHTDQGRIVGWKLGEKIGTYLIEVHGQLEFLELRSLREVWIFLHGIMTTKNGASAEK